MFIFNVYMQLYTFITYIIYICSQYYNIRDVL